MSFSMGGGGGFVMKNIENNFCWNTVSIQTESQRAGQQKYLAKGPFVLKLREQRYSRSAQGYYTVARRYEFYIRVARTISHE